MAGVPQLRSYIPIAAPARREPTDGTEARLRVSPGFEPAWFRERVAVDFSKRWHTDPLYRRRTLALMRRELLRAFPSTDYWSARDELELATISGCYGICVVPAVFGKKIRYHADRWPELEPGQELTIERVEKLDVRELLAGPFVEALFRQMEAIAAEWGTIRGHLNYQGVLNNAFHLRGQQVLTDLTDRPEFAEHLFWLITEIIIGLAQMVQERQRKAGLAVNQLAVSNCTVNMVSPATYRRFLLTHDRAIAESFERFGVHTCNWNATPYLKVLGALPKVGYIDVGMMSDLKKVREAFPLARRAVLYSPSRLDQASLEEIRADVERIGAELAPCDVVMADIQAGTPDARVNALIQMCRELSGA